MSEPDPADVFSPGALAELQDALDTDLQPGNRDDAALHHAVDRLCAEAHDHHLPPEKMLIAVKAAWGHLTLRQTDNGGRKRAAFDRVVGVCIRAYFDAV